MALPQNPKIQLEYYYTVTVDLQLPKLIGTVTSLDMGKIIFRR